MDLVPSYTEMLATALHMAEDLFACTWMISGGHAPEQTRRHEGNGVAVLRRRRKGSARSTFSNLWRSHNLKPHRVKSFKLSRDPTFLAKMIDVIGLYQVSPDLCEQYSDSSKC
jgi:hypothetical protein